MSRTQCRRKLGPAFSKVCVLDWLPRHVWKGSLVRGPAFRIWPDIPCRLVVDAAW